MRYATTAAAVLLVVCSCAFVSRTPRLVPRLEQDGLPVANSPARVHMLDGSVVVYSSGLSVGHGAILGRGVRYDLLRQNSMPVTTIPLESVVGVESYDKHTNVGPGIALAPVGVAGAYGCAVGTVLLLKAIFGSCPTVYAFDGSDYALEAEAFSYSIARFVEDRDLDRLDLGRPVDGEYRLMVTNEALETHYINSLSLTTVDHAIDCEALPTDDGRVLLFGQPGTLARATSRDGHDVSRLLAARDSGWYETDTAQVRRLSDSVGRDWVDIAVPVPANARTACLAFKFRNTLLNTVLLYDATLRQLGLGALDWMAEGATDVFSGLRLRNWYMKRFGLHILAPSGKGFREVARIRDTGPICWHEVAVELRVQDRDTLRLRLDFLPGNLAVDWVGVSFEDVGTPKNRTVYCDRVEDGDGTPLPEACGMLRANDGRYFITGPSDCYYLSFRPAPVPAGKRRTWFVRTGGYYIEWLRPDWLATEPAARFEPKDASVMRAAVLWLNKKTEMERQFFETRLPVRRAR